MKYDDAVKLHAGDEITLKENGVTMTVAWIENYKGRKTVIVHPVEDGSEYDHLKIK